MGTAVEIDQRPRLRKSERRKQILLDLRLQPHLRIAELAEEFGVSAETIRRDLEALSAEGLLSRAHGGASALPQGHYPSFEERNSARVVERERIGRLAASLIKPGETIMVDSGSTTVQMARFLAFQGTRCTVLTNSLPVAMTLGHGDGVEVILCPGDYLPEEAAVVGPDAIEFIERHHVDRCLIGASGLSQTGPSETVRGFAAIKRTMMRQSAKAHLLIDGDKFGRRGLARVGALNEITSIIVDQPPETELEAALTSAKVEVLVA